MSDEWQYQLRIYLPDELVEVARNEPNSPALEPLAAILACGSQSGARPEATPS